VTLIVKKLTLVDLHTYGPGTFNYGGPPKSDIRP